MSVGVGECVVLEQFGMGAGYGALGVWSDSSIRRIRSVAEKDAIQL